MADDFCFAEDRFLLVGKITKAHGLKGEIKVFPYSGDGETLLGYSRVVLVDKKGTLSAELEIESSRIHGKQAVFKLSGISDRNTAEALQDTGILVRKDDLPEIEEDEYYWYKLYGAEVLTEEGRRVGIVDSIFSNGAQDIMVVLEGEREYLIPLIESVVKEQNDTSVIITPPPGLLEINTGEYE